ncbi:MAG: glmU [Chloroflexi bacterium]|nr:glmU [Chloroflexota bacterium]
MVARVVRAVRSAGITDIVVVASSDSELMSQYLPDDAILAIQASPGGTGDAVRVGLRAISERAQRVIVVGGDTPLVSADTIRAVATCVPPATVALAAASIEDPTGYGRLILGDGPGRVLRIVEEADASAKELALRLVNGMVFAFDAAWLRAELPTIEPSPIGEIYLTALIAMAASEGREVRAIEADDPWEIMGVNTRRQLALAEAALRIRVNNALMDHGVSLVGGTSSSSRAVTFAGQRLFRKAA